MKLICTNDYGESLTVQYAFPFYYVSCDGLMAYTSNVVTVEPYIAGEVYQGSHNPKRNLVLTFAVRHQDYWGIRDRVYSVFGAPGQFTWEPDEGAQRSIRYYVESIELSDPNSQGFRQYSVSLVCPFPFFSGAQNTIKMSYWKKCMTLPFTMHSPFKVGERVSEQIKNIYNPQPISIGIKAVFTAINGEVANPGLQNLSTGESFKLDGFLPSGSSMLVSTLNGQKYAQYLLEEPQPFDLWDYQANDWIQLRPGDNLLRYDADSGLEYLDVSVSYSQLYLGG